MPLCFNLFGLLKLDLALASRVFGELFPDLAGATVQAVLFEHSPGRGDAALTGDHSAFDVLLRYETPAGRTGFVAIEVKYSESGLEPVPAIRLRYGDLAEVSGPFVELTELSLQPACRNTTEGHEPLPLRLDRASIADCKMDQFRYLLNGTVPL